MKKVLSISTVLLVIALFAFSLVGCPDRAMAPKEEPKKAETAAPAAPAPAPEQTPAAPATK
ncbi:MAG: hypothetical protein LLG93_08845 [Deltaproteobacteria bacterium]|nr:hypothetical protein [Deltaproteobacteria bacterium]